MGFTYQDYLYHSGVKPSRSKYSGGFTQVNGRTNNTKEYNHDYYVKNKDKHGRPKTDATGPAKAEAQAILNLSDNPEYLTELGMWFPETDPRQVDYYIDWNNPDSAFYNYEKFDMSGYKKVYGDNYREAAFRDFALPPYDKLNRVLYDRDEGRVYVMTTDPKVTGQLSKTNDTYDIDGKKAGLFTFKDKKASELSQDPFMREQAAKKVGHKAAEAINSAIEAVNNAKKKK